MDTSKKNNKKPAEEAKKDEIYSGLFQPQKGSSRVFSFGEGMNKVSVVELDNNLNLKDSVLISGFPESSLTCVLTTGYLADVLKLPTVAVIECSSFPALAIIENGTPLPPVRIMGTKDIVVVQCEFKLPSDEIQENVVAAVLDFSHRHGIRLFFTIDGIPTKQMDPEGTKVMRFITSDEKFSKYMLGKGHNGVKDGIVSALTARILLANSMGRSTVPVACLLVPSHVAYPDAYSAVLTVKTLDGFLDWIEINTDELERKAKDLEAQVTAAIRAQSAAARPPPQSMYN